MPFFRFPYKNIYKLSLLYRNMIYIITIIIIYKYAQTIKQLGHNVKFSMGTLFKENGSVLFVLVEIHMRSPTAVRHRCA